MLHVVSNCLPCVTKQCFTFSTIAVTIVKLVTRLIIVLQVHGRNPKVSLGKGTGCGKLTSFLYEYIHLPSSKIVNGFSGLEVLTAVVMKVTIFCDVAPCTPYMNDVSEERITSIFKVENEPSKTTSVPSYLIYTGFFLG
jgi:hypothetical protein